MKYRCVVCDWIYDPELGDPDGQDRPRELPSKNYPMIGYAGRGVGKEDFEP